MVALNSYMEICCAKMCGVSISPEKVCNCSNSRLLLVCRFCWIVLDRVNNPFFKLDTDTLSGSLIYSSLMLWSDILLNISASGRDVL